MSSPHGWERRSLTSVLQNEEKTQHVFPFFFECLLRFARPRLVLTTSSLMNQLPTFSDFFAGIGFVRIALEARGWVCRYEVDHSPLKARLHRHHFGASDLYDIRDVAHVEADDLPDVTLAHASFPCTDLSVAGSRQGLHEGESAAFWHFARLIESLQDRRPSLILIENVEGLLSSHGGADLWTLLNTLNELGYAVDLLSIDAASFVPQSRGRLFIPAVFQDTLQDALAQAYALDLPTEARSSKVKGFIRSHPELNWSLRPLPPLPSRQQVLADVVDPNEPWWDDFRTTYLLNQMFDRHLAWLRSAQNKLEWSYGTVFRRMRMRDGEKRSTAELRTDGVAGCLRTPKGGSARQIIVRAGFGRLDARLLNAKEAARLMGADAFRISDDEPLNDYLFGFGDAVCVPAVAWVSEHWLEPALRDLQERPVSRLVSA